MCGSNDRILSKMTPRVLTWVESDTGESSKVIEGVFSLIIVAFERTFNAIKLFNLRKLAVKHPLISATHSERMGEANSF